MTMLSMSNLDLAGKRVLIREDLNVPINDNKITSDARIRAALPTIELARKAGAKVIIMSHLGRPSEGTQTDDKYSLQVVADHLSSLLNTPVPLCSDWKDGISMNDGDVVLLENVRFNSGESSNDDDLAKAYASLCDVFVMDAFGTAHRAQASTHGVAKFAPTACAGPLLISELDTLESALANPARPLVAIVGGSKVSTKLTVLESLAEKADTILVGGGIANTFIAAAGYDVGKSLYEEALIPNALALMEKTTIPVPTDAIVATEFSDTAIANLKHADKIYEDEMILDIGPETVNTFYEIIENAKTILWNGPVGVFELPQFGEGTHAIAIAIAENDGVSIAGGGDTLAAIDKFNIADKISYISTGGGAFLEYVEGKTLAAVAILEERAASA